MTPPVTWPESLGSPSDVLAAASVVAVVLISLVITRIATVALTLTGMSRDAARFQARSALSGVGFTTSEAESVVNHPSRRRVVMTLMLVGSAGIVTAVATLIISLGDAGSEQRLDRVALVLGGLLAVWLLARSRWIDRRLTPVIAAALGRFTSLDTRDYSALLHLGSDHAVTEFRVGERSPLAGHTIRELRLRDEGVVVLGLTRAGRYIAAPGLQEHIRPGDVVLVYGDESRIAELAAARQGR